jgi:hypothetical protein
LFSSHFIIQISLFYHYYPSISCHSLTGSV